MNRDERRLHQEPVGSWALTDVQQKRHVLGDVYSLAKGGGPRFKGYRPSRSNLKYYEQRQRKDVEGLYSGRPYESPELGFSPQEMEARFGARTDEMGAARSGELQRIEGAFRGGTASGMRTGAYHRGIQRVEQGDLARRGESRRSNILADAVQRRQDWMARHGLVRGAYGQGTGIYDAYAKGRYQADVARFGKNVKSINNIEAAIASMGASEAVGAGWGRNAGG